VLADLLGAPLLERYRDWFGVRFEFLLCDVIFVEDMVERREVRWRVVGRPGGLVAEPLARPGLELASVPKTVQNGVEKNGQ
jgi:hypothetical protein